MPASSERQRIYECDGFVAVPDLFSRAETARAKDEIRQVLQLLRSQPPAPDAPPRDNGVYVGLSRRSALLCKLNADPRLVDILQELIGPHIEFWSDKVVYKSAAVDFGSPWHQDWPYWKGAHKLSAWIALDDATPQNGCLRFLPGSHRHILAHTGKDGEGIGFVNRLRPEQVEESQAVVLPASAGTVVFFHDLTLHASFKNTSGLDRWALISTFRDAAADDYEYAWQRGFLISGQKSGKSLGLVTQ